MARKNPCKWKHCSIDGSVLIITCATTRCVHLQLFLAQDTSSFLRAWRRFITCRGVHPSLVFSDCGRAFVAAEEPIREWIEEWDQNLIKRTLIKDGTKFEWKYNVPTASHMNGVVESLINSVRKALDVSVINYTHSQLTYEQWATVLLEITYLINSRPLFPDGNPRISTVLPEITCYILMDKRLLFNHQLTKELTPGTC